MSRFKNGVSYYTFGDAMIRVAFPEDEVTCYHCWLIDKDKIGRPVCRALQNRELYYIQEGVHKDCPLKFRREGNESVSAAE
jgi:hypothetical protein